MINKLNRTSLRSFQQQVHKLKPVEKKIVERDSSKQLAQSRNSSQQYKQQLSKRAEAFQKTGVLPTFNRGAAGGVSSQSLHAILDKRTPIKVPVHQPMRMIDEPQLLPQPRKIVDELGSLPELDPISVPSSEQPTESSMTKPIVSVGELDSEGMHLNQYDGDPNSSNADCGPTSLAMALHSVGLAVPGDKQSSTVDSVQATRQAMYQQLDNPSDNADVNTQNEVRAARDGVDADGNRVDSEHGKWSSFGSIIEGAEAAGATTIEIPGTTEAIAEQVQKGNPVIVNGNPGEDGGGWSDYNDGHFITVSGYDKETDTFTINDPLDNAPREISSEELNDYIKNWRAIAIENPNTEPTLSRHGDISLE